MDFSPRRPTARVLLRFLFALVGVSVAATAACAGDRITFADGTTADGVFDGLDDGGDVRWRFDSGGRVAVPPGLIERVEYGLAPDEVPVGPTLAEPVVPLVSAANDTGPPPRFGPTRWYANPVTAGVRGTLTLLSLDPDEVFGEINEWTRRVEIGGSWVRGNNQIFRFTSGGLLERRSGRYAVAAEWGGRFARNQGEVDENRWWLNTNLDNDRGGDWLLFWTARHEYDEFRDLHYRGTFATGAGYRVIDDKEHRLILRLGPGAVVESFEQPRGTDVTGNLLAEVDLRWPVWQRTIVEHRTTGNRAFDAAGDVRLINSSGLVVPLDEDGRWSFRLGLRHEYESRPNAGRANNDVTTSIRLVYTRKPGDKNRKVKAPQILP